MIGKKPEKFSNDWKKTEPAFPSLEKPAGGGLFEGRAFDVAIVGAGPAGLMAAIAAGRTGARVIVCEQLDRPGVKLLATGGGRCNLTNTAAPERFIECFGRRGRFIQPALEALKPATLRTFFEEQRVPTISPDGFHVYPASQSAASVQQALCKMAEPLRVQWALGTQAARLGLEENLITGLETSRGFIEARRIILACGGKGYPKLGGTGGGYALAEQAGHTLAEPLPALVPLVARETWPRACAGASMSGARLWVDAMGFPKEGFSGDLLLTHRGVSGPVALDISADISQLLRRQPEVPIRIAPLPGVTASEWEACFDAWRAQKGRKQISSLLDERLPASVAEAACLAANVPRHTLSARLSAEQRRRLIQSLTGLSLTIIGTEGFDHAMATRGGVSLRDVDPGTMGSRLVPGLYFAGEMLDLDAPCGGYNLQWAFSSGYLAGRSAGKA